MYSVIIVGGGPAALAAAVYALDKQLDVLVIAENIGGKVGAQPQLDAEQATAYQVSQAAVHLFERWVSARPNLIVRDRVVDITRLDDHLLVNMQRHGVQESTTVIVATGVSPITLDVPGAQRWLGYGLGYSPTTHAQLLAGKTVGVVGATPRALRGAAELARTAAQVYLVLPDAGAIDNVLLDDLRQQSNVSVLANYRVTELVGAANLERLAIEREGETAYVPVDAVFADLGLLPHSEMVRRIVQVDSDGFIMVDEHHATTLPGLFAAGDVTTTFSEQLVVALGDGTRAAANAYQYLLAQQYPERRG